MASSFTWLDYSEKDRQKMLDLLSALKEHDTRDKLRIDLSPPHGFGPMDNQ
jgi:hypothetical protein